MLTGTNLVYTRKYNLRIIHEVIRLFGPISRADIARRTELTGQTVWNLLVKELLAPSPRAGGKACPPCDRRASIAVEIEMRMGPLRDSSPHRCRA